MTSTLAVHLQPIGDVYPGLPIDPTTVQVRRGQFNDIFIVNDEMVLRFPRTPEAAATLATETALLRALQGRLPLSIPNPVYTGFDRSTGTPTFTGYHVIAGDPLWRSELATLPEETLHRLASQLAAFLRMLHGIPTADLDLTLPIADDMNAWTSLYHAFRDDLFPFMRSDARDHVAATFESFLTESRHFTYQPVLRHGDFGGSNILFKRQTHTITGVIDFSSAALGDPAVDFAAVSSYGDQFLEHLSAGYPELATPEIRELARFYQSTHALQQALWAHRAGDQAEFDDGMAAYV